MRFPAELAERLEKFGLEIEPTKTKVVEFGRDAEAHARAREERPQTFDFLGFTHYCSRLKDGKRFRMKRVTSRKKFSGEASDIQGMAEEVTSDANVVDHGEGSAEASRALCVLRGVTDNYRGIARFHREVTKLLYKWLNRRSQRRSYTWAEFEGLLKLFPLPGPRVRVHLYYRARTNV